MMDFLQERHINTGSQRAALPQQLALMHQLRKMAIFREAMPSL